MLNENKALIRRYVEECIGKGDLSLMDELLAPSYALHMNADNFDLQGYKQFQPSVLAAFPERDTVQPHRRGQDCRGMGSLRRCHDVPRTWPEVSPARVG